MISKKEKKLLENVDKMSYDDLINRDISKLSSFELQQLVFKIDWIERTKSAFETKDRAREYYNKTRYEQEFRAQTVSVGKTVGDNIEISLRNPAYCMFHVMNIKEASELIHSLAGAIGCHIYLKPREDFASVDRWIGITNHLDNLSLPNPEKVKPPKLPKPKKNIQRGKDDLGT